MTDEKSTEFNENSSLGKSKTPSKKKNTLDTGRNLNQTFLKLTMAHYLLPGATGAGLQSVTN